MILFDKCTHTHTLGMKAPPNSGFTQMIIYSYMTVRSGKYSVMHVFLNIYYMKEIQLVMRKQTCNHLCPTSAILPCTASQGGSEPAWDPQVLNHRWLEDPIKMDDLGGKPLIFWTPPNLAQLPPTNKKKKASRGASISSIESRGATVWQLNIFRPEEV